MVAYEFNGVKPEKKKATDRKQAIQIKWSKPSPGWSKLNVDGSWMANGATGGAGMILRDDQGAVIFTACRHLVYCDSPLEAELRACAEGLFLAM